jgi:uncharacterized protein
MKKRFIVVHRWSGGPQDDWRPWLAEKLIEAGHEVILPSMPDTEEPVIGKWVGHLRSVVENPDENTYFVGHSIGCQAIMRYLETIDVMVGGAYFVAPWFNLANLEDDDVARIAKPWLETPVDFEAIKMVCSSITSFLSTNEPFGFVEDNKKILEENLSATVYILENRGHFIENDGITEFPELLEQIVK